MLLSKLILHSGNIALQVFLHGNRTGSILYFLQHVFRIALYLQFCQKSDVLVLNFQTIFFYHSLNELPFRRLFFKLSPSALIYDFFSWKTTRFYNSLLKVEQILSLNVEVNILSYGTFLRNQFFFVNIDYVLMYIYVHGSKNRVVSCAGD